VSRDGTGTGYPPGDRSLPVLIVSHIPKFGDERKSPSVDVVASPDYGICDIAVVILMRVPRIQNFETRIWQQKIDYLNPIGF
jgi:hypothetical protein